MKKSIVLAALASSVMLAGCGGCANDLLAGPEELACLDAIRSTLTNPETASFHDFQKMGEQDGKALYGVRVRAEVDYNCTFTSDYVMLDERLYQGPSSNAGECGDMREQSNLMTNRMREQEGVELLGFGETKFLEKKYIYK